MNANLSALAGIDGEVVDTPIAQLMETPPRCENGKPFTTEAKWYRLSPPLVSEGWEGTETHRYVVVSASDRPDFGICETYIFPCDETGKITGWLELPGSFQGGLDHEAALQGAGYVVVK